jgi:catechol 2,3-dioxygenase-like lactoylglutathione lyase family enzyme
MLMLNGATSHATVAVTDIDRAKEFYGKTLGFAAKDDVSGGVTYETGGTWFLVYPSQFAGTAKSTAMAFEVEDLNATVKAMREAGIAFEDYDFPGLKTVDGIAEIEGERTAWFKDPDGNIIAVGERT